MEVPRSRLTHLVKYDTIPRSSSHRSHVVDVTDVAEYMTGGYLGCPEFSVYPLPADAKFVKEKYKDFIRRDKR